MPTISHTQDCQTVMTTFEVTPGTAQDLMDALREAFDDFISKQPGFIAAALHINDAQTRVAGYSQWEKREDFQAMLRAPEMRGHMRKFSEHCKTFEPVLYDVVGSYN